MSDIRLPTPALVVLVGAAASGKSTWAQENGRPGEVVSSDALREQIGEHAMDQGANADAFALLDDIVRRRLARGLFTIVDATNLPAEPRAKFRAMAATAGVPCIVVAFPTDPAECRRRNNLRQRSVPAAVLAKQLAQFEDALALLPSEGFDAVHVEAGALRRVATAVTREMTSATGLRFGLQLPRHGWPGGAAETGARMRDLAQAADEVGFESLWVMDHFIQIPQAGRVWDDLLEAYTTLGFLAGVTSHIRLGTLVTGVTYRNVALLAKIIATLDVVSGGRVIAGLGAAWYEHEHTAYGFEFPPLAQRYALLEDALELLPLMWGKGKPAYQGRVITVPDTTCYPRPIQEHIPVLIGGSGEKKTLRLVAQYADACNVFGDPAMVAHKIEVLHGHCAALGRDPAEIAVTVLTTAKQAVTGRALGKEVDRYAEYAAVGVNTVIVNMPGTPGAEDVTAFSPVIQAFNN